MSTLYDEMRSLPGGEWSDNPPSVSQITLSLLTQQELAELSQEHHIPSPGSQLKITLYIRKQVMEPIHRS